jgi:hypothetical protein
MFFAILPCSLYSFLEFVFSALLNSVKSNFCYYFYKGMMPSVLGVDGYNPSAPQYDQAMAKSEGKMDINEGGPSSAPKPVV